MDTFRLVRKDGDEGPAWRIEWANPVRAPIILDRAFRSDAEARVWVERLNTLAVGTGEVFGFGSASAAAASGPARAKYRFYLLDRRSHVTATEWFAAASDGEATEIAAAMHEACADAFDGFEIWHGIKCLQRRRNAQGKQPAPELFVTLMKHQDAVCELHDRLSATFPAVKASERLRELMAQLRLSPDDRGPRDASDAGRRVPRRAAAARERQRA